MAAPEGVRGKILLAAQEITFAKVLAGNDKPTRDRGVKRLRKWLTARSEGSLGTYLIPDYRLWYARCSCLVCMLLVFFKLLLVFYLLEPIIVK